MSESSARWVVLKFGGTSVASADNWRAIAARVQACLGEGLRPLVVVSALRGVTDDLEALISAPSETDRGALLAAIQARHVALARALGVETPAELETQIRSIARAANALAGAGQDRSKSAAEILAAGELMSSRLGALFLKQVAGLDCVWEDARTILRSEESADADPQAAYLAARCVHEPDALLQRRLGETGDVILTQGFIAANERNETVVLGRGGSDTSAACMAGLVNACRLEIWSDVPGLFTADPRTVPSARLLRNLDYAEAQELATMGGKVLHPRCISPLRKLGIPLHLGCTGRADLEGTRVTAAGDATPRVKAVSSKPGVTLVAMQTVEMWHHVGFLADAFDCFRRHGFSVDLVSTSETNVTVTLDSSDGRVRTSALDDLTADLARICKVTLVENCAAVSLIGRHIRAILHRLGPVLELFEEHRIHLLSQAANDLNFSVVVDSQQANRLVEQLHNIVVASNAGEDFLGATWQQVFEPVNQKKGPEAWWRNKRAALLAATPRNEAVYAYDLASIDSSIAALRSMRAVSRHLFAVKSNWQPDVLRRMHDQGLGFECVSEGEVRYVLEQVPEVDPERILFTPNFAPASEYAFGLAAGVRVTLDSLAPLEAWPELFNGAELFVRLDLGKGRGHHQHVRTAGVHSKFGVPLFELERLSQLARRHSVQIVGLHSHAGSGVLLADHWPEMATQMAALTREFPDVRVLDIGGGLGIPEKPGAAGLDLEELDQGLAAVTEQWPDLELWLEPGRFLVAGAGVLLARVTQIKGKGAQRFVGINTGMNSLIRPMLYGAWHEIVNLTRLDEPPVGYANVVGPICESGDTLGRDRLLPRCEEGDVILIANTGAYGRVMGSSYNLRLPAGEIVL